MKKILIFAGLISTFSCQNEGLTPNTCRIREPLKELAWLQDSISTHPNIADITITQASYKGSTVFKLDSFLGVDASTATIYRCDGSVICRSFLTIGGLAGNCRDITNKLKDRNVIYERKR